MTDPCACDARCPHGEGCLAGHANYPDRHWYPCQTCTPTRQVTFAEAHDWRRRRLDDLRAGAAERRRTMPFTSDTAEEIEEMAETSRAFGALQSWPEEDR